MLRGEDRKVGGGGGGGVRKLPHLVNSAGREKRKGENIGE